MKCALSGAFPELIEDSANNHASLSVMTCAEQKSQLQIEYWKNKYIEPFKKHTELSLNLTTV
jgi:hypothetical protein